MTLSGRLFAVEERFDAVAICTGVHSKPKVPTTHGKSEFAGAILHSSEVTEASLTGKKIVVVGGSKSGTDIAVAASRRTPHALTWVRRRDVWRVPSTILGVNFKRLLYPRAQEILIPSPWGQGRVSRAIRWLIAPIVWLRSGGAEYSTDRGDAAAATWIVRGPRVAATPPRRRGSFVDNASRRRGGGAAGRPRTTLRGAGISRC